jgi:hypothetical protein
MVREGETPSRTLPHEDIMSRRYPPMDHRFEENRGGRPRGEGGSAGSPHKRLTSINQYRKATGNGRKER